MKPDAHNSLVGKKVFVTGGTGLFGKWLIPSLCQLAESVTVLTRDCANAQKSLTSDYYENLRFFHGDVRTFRFPDESFDYLIHAATPVSVDSSDLGEDELLSIIVEGTARTLAFAQNTRIGKFLLVSSGAVYGPQPKDLKSIPESFPCSPVSPYGKGKLIAENLCLNSGLDCVVARCFAFVGPYMPLNGQFAIANFIGDCIHREAIRIKGDGQCLRSYMHSTDLVDWLLSLLLHSSKNEIYNVGSSVPVSILDLAYLVRKTSGRKNLPVLIEKDGCASSCNYIPNNEKASCELGLDLSFGLKKAILKTFESYTV